jgi:hypothetical protein
MGKVAGFRSLGSIARRAPSTPRRRSWARAAPARADATEKPRSFDAEDARRATDGERIRAAALHQPAAVAGLTNKDDGRATLAERMISDGINNPARIVTGDARPATDGERIRAAGLHQPAAVARLTNKDDGRATLAERIRADGLS